MYRATTPTHVFKFTQDTDDFDVMIVTYSQHGNKVLEKTKEGFTFTTQGEYYLASVTLTQEETNLFDAKYPCLIQVKVKDTDGVIMVSQIERMDVESVLNEEVI